MHIRIILNKGLVFIFACTRP